MTWKGKLRLNQKLDINIEKVLQEFPRLMSSKIPRHQNVMGNNMMHIIRCKLCDINKQRKKNPLIFKTLS
jgi:hypothetical protein